MKHVIVLMLAVLVMFASKPVLGDDLYVMFKPGVVQLRNGDFPKGQITVKEIKSTTIVSMLNKSGCIKIRETVPSNWSDTMVVETDGTVIKKLDRSRLFVLSFEQYVDDKFIDFLNSNPDIVLAERQIHRKAEVLPNDTYLNLQWGLYQSSNRNDIHAMEAWDIFKGSNSILVGIIDHGVQLDHEDIVGRVSGDNPSVSPDYHGTFVAGIIGATTNNNLGVAGVDWNANLFSYHVNYDDDDDISYSFVRCVDVGSQVVNCSWGGYASSLVEKEGASYAYKRNRVVVASSGNDNTSNTHYPSCYKPCVICVGATDRNDARSSFSNFGSTLDVVAPGGVDASHTNPDNVYSTTQRGTTKYEYGSGTSFAAPYVSGIASLLKGYDPNLANDDIEHIIQLSADKVQGMGGADWTQYYGYGRVNARKALEMLGPNYALNRFSTSGGTDASVSNLVSTSFYTVPGLADGSYLVYRHEIINNVTFPVKYNVIPVVWGRGVGSNGFNADVANCAIPFTEVVPGSVTKTGCQLRTYIYKVYNFIPQLVGWFPFQNPASAVFQYTVFSPYSAPTSISMHGSYDATSGKAPVGYINLSWACTPGTFNVTYTLQRKQPYSTGTWGNYISNTTITSYSYQQYPPEGGVGYRVIVNDGRSTFTSNAVAIYPPVAGDPIVSPSLNTTATAFSNGKKLAIDSEGKLYVTYTSGDTVYYTTSTDDGNNWSNPTFIGFGKNPTIQLKPTTVAKRCGGAANTELPSICYISGNQLYNADQTSTGWAAPQNIYTGQEGEEISYLSYVVNQTNSQSYVGWVSTTPGGAQVSVSPYTPGSSQSQLSPTPVDQGGSSTLFKSPSMAIGKGGNLITSWSNNGVVKYNDGNGVIELSDPNTNCIHPIVSTYGDRTSVAWMEQISPGIKNEAGKYQIVARDKTADGWTDPILISYPDSGDAQFPVVAANGQYIFTKEIGDGNYDISYVGNYANGWESYIQNISFNSGGQSNYPDVLFRPSWPQHKLYILWSEENSSKAIIAPVHVKMYVRQIDPVPSFTVYPKVESSSQYNVQRAGAICYGTGVYQVVDYDPHKLIYHFDGLNPSQRYKVQAVYYRNTTTSSKGGQSDDWHEMLKAGSTTLANTHVPETTVVKEVQLIPKNRYLNGQVDITIERKKGDYALCAALELIEYEGDGNIAKDADETMQDNLTGLLYHYELAQNKPNPCAGSTQFRYQLANSGRTSFKVYNTLGQVVKTLVNQDQPAGVYNVIWDGKDESGKSVANGIYFYRLNSGSYSNIKKLVMIK